METTWVINRTAPKDLAHDERKRLLDFFQIMMKKWLFHRILRPIDGWQDGIIVF